MPNKALISSELEDDTGNFCTLGVIGNARKIDMKKIDPEDHFKVSNIFNISNALAREIVFENDEVCDYHYTPEKRWEHMYNWAKSNLKVGS